MYNCEEYILLRDSIENLPKESPCNDINADDVIKIIGDAINRLISEAEDRMNKTNIEKVDYWYCKGMADVLKQISKALEEAGND